MPEPDQPPPPGDKTPPPGDTPTPPAATPPSEPPRRRGWGRRLLRVMFVLLLFVFVPIVVGIAVLHTPAGRRAVQSLVESTVGSAVQGQLKMGRLYYNILEGRVEASDVHLTMEGTTLDLASAEARWGPKKGGRVRIVRPSIVLRDTGKPKPVQTAVGIAAKPWSILERLSQAELVDGRIEMQDVKGVPYLVLGRIDASMQERHGHRPIQLTVKDGVLGPKQRQLSPVIVNGDLTVANGQLVFNSVHVAAPKNTTIDLAGQLDRLSPNQGALKLRADADGALAGIVAPETKVTGRIRAQADVVAKETMSGSLRITAPDLTVQDIGPWDASLRGRFDSAHMVIEWAEAVGYDGRFTIQGPVAMADNSKTDLVLKAETVDLGALAQAAAKTDVPVRSRLDAQVRYTLQGWDVNQGRAEGGFTLTPQPAAVRRRRGTPPGVPVAASAKITVEGRRVRLRDLRVDAHNGLLVGDLAVSPALDIQGRYRLTLPLSSVPALEADMGMAASGTPLVGTITAEGQLGGKAQDPVATVKLTGEGIATQATAKQATASIEGNARYQRGRLQINPLVVRSSTGGQATFTGAVPVTKAGGGYDLNGVVNALDLRPMLEIAGVDGRGPLNGRVRIEGPQARPFARADLDARVTLAGSEQPIEVSLAGSGTAERMALDRFTATLAGGRVEGSGSYEAKTRAIQAKATAQGLHLAQLPLLPASAKAVDGVLAADIALSGPADAPAGDVRGTLTGATYSGSPLPNLDLVGHSDGRQVTLTGTTGGDAARPGSGSVFLRGNGSFSDDEPLHLVLDLAALPTKQLLDATPAARQQQATLNVQGRIVIDVPLRKPGELRYTTEGLLASGHLRELDWSTQTFRVQGNAREATIHGLQLTTTTNVPASRQRTEAEQSGAAPPPSISAQTADRSARGPAGGTLAIEGRVPLAADQRFDLTVKGAMDLAALRPMLVSGWVAGQASADLKVGGTMGAPDMAGQLALNDVRGMFGSVRVNGVQALARFQGDHATLDRFEARMLGGRITAGGTFPVRKLGGAAPARLHFQVADLDLSLLSTPGGQIQGMPRDPDQPGFYLSMEGDVEATAPSVEGIRARGRFTRLEQQTPEGSIALQAPAEWTLENGRFVQSPIRLAGPLGTLEARAEARIAGGPMAGTAVFAGPFELRMLNPFLTDMTLGGPARADVRASWDAKGVRLDGGLSVENGRLTLESVQFTANPIKGQLRLLGDRMTIDATAAAADGQLTVSGGMTFGAQLLGPADIRIVAKQVPINYPEGFRGRASGTIRVSGDPNGYTVGGEVDLSQAFYTAEFDQRKQSLDRLDWQLAALSGNPSLTESMPLSIQVRLTDPLRIRNKTAQLDIVGDLEVGGTAAQPVVAGQLTLLENGQLAIRKSQIRTQQSRIELNGYPAGQPEVDFEGIAQVTGIEMQVRARGTIDDLQLEITSPNRPDLSQTDLIWLLLWGSTPQAGAADSTAIVAEQVASALGGVLQKGFGQTVLVDVSPERSLLNDDIDPTQRFNIGTRLRQDLMVLYSMKLDGNDQRWIVELNPRGGRLRFRLITQQNQGVSYEVSDRFSVNIFGGRAPTKPKQENLKVVELHFEGQLPLPEKDLKKASGIKIGHRYDILGREKAADKVRAMLVKAGWRASNVDATWETAKGHQESLALTLHVDPGPKVLISWKGDDPGKKIRKQAEGSWPAYASPEAAAVNVARTARVALRAKGYYDAKVGHDVHVVDGRAELALAVQRGPKGKGIDVHFDGNQAISEEELREGLPKTGSKEFFEALEGRADYITGEVRLAYARIGYLQARVGRPRQLFDKETDRLEVTVPIRERGPSRVSRVEMPSELQAAGTSGPKLALAPGAPFDVDKYLADRDTIASWYRTNGWMDARVRGVLEPSGGDVVVRYEVIAGPRPRVNEVRVATDGRPKPELLMKSVVSEPGELITPHELALSRERLSSLQIFRSVDVRPVPVDGRDDVRDIAVQYTERPDLDIEYGLRYSPSGASSVGGAPSTPDNGRIQLAAAVEATDPFGWGWRVRPYTFLTRNRYTWGVSLESATLFGLRIGSQISVFDDRDNRSQVATLAAHVRGFTIQQTRSLLKDTSSRNWHDRLRLQWGYANKNIQYSTLQTSVLTGTGGLPPEAVPPATSVPLIAGQRAYATLSLIGDERDSFTDPHHGMFWTATTELSRKGLGSDVDYERLYGQFFFYLPLPFNMVWAQGYRAGVVPGSDPLLLLESRFQAGGPTTVRGFSQNDLGPQYGGDGLGGQAVAIFNQELRFPIWKGPLTVNGGVFWDAGNVWALSRDFSLGDLRHDVGAGLRIMFPFGPIRLEYAFVLNRRPGEHSGRFVFGLGHAF